MDLKQLYRLIYLIGTSLLCHSCAFYSFSGTSLSKEVKTFSIQNFQDRTTLGPADLAEQLTEKLSNELLQKTPLKQLDANGDIHFEGSITEFKYSPMSPSISLEGEAASRMKLTLTVEVTYINKYDQEFEFSKKSFTQSADMDATANIIAEEPRMVEEALTKLVKDIFNASVASW
jgi:hypothetical protein